MEVKRVEGFHGEEEAEERGRDPGPEGLWLISMPGIQKASNNIWLNKRLLVVLVGFPWKQTLK